ncbi:MAG TPA: PqiC family protein [Kofleriaceae bacterium]|nr:PqiC family protein [Kofleriaceae bacterium]
MTAIKALVLALLLVGCRSANSEYYTLVPPPSERRTPVTEAFQLDVLPVDVPPEVDRPEIVVREGRGKVTPVETRSWISPLARELRHALSDGLTSALGVRDVAGATPVAGIPTYRIKLVVQRFDSSLGTRASIEAISTIRDANGQAPAVVCSHRSSEAAGPGYEQLAEAHQRAVAAIAAQVAATIRGIQAGTAGCRT